LRSDPVYRAVAIVAQRIITDGEELFVNYLEDFRCPVEYTPDWLLEPPPASPYLTKKERTVEMPLLVKLVHSYHVARMGRKAEEFEGRVKKELPMEEQLERKKIVQAKLEKIKEMEEEERRGKIGSS